MRVSVLALILVMLFSVEVNAQSEVEPDSRPEVARSAYEAADYAAAVVLYQSLLADGIQNAAVYQNLGSAFYHTGEQGHALVNYLRAHQLEPRYAPLDALIARIRAERIDRLRPEAELIDLAGTLTNAVLTLRELELLAFLMWTAWCGLLAQGMLRAIGWKRLRLPFAVMTLLLIIVLGILLLRQYVTYQRPQAVVVALSAEVMSGPGESYLPLYALYAAAELRLHEVRGEWARFMLADGRQGWIRLAAVERVFP